MKLNFLKCSPSKNTTVLITDYVSPVLYKGITQAVMSYEYLQAEQVGFIVPPQSSQAILKLEMSGNEFCGNAVLSAAAYVHHKEICWDNTFYIESSGVDKLIYCEVKGKTKNVLKIKAEMPKPDKMEKITIDIEGKTVSGCLVDLPGISHFVTNYCPARSDYDKVLHILQNKSDAQAIGIIPYQKLEEKRYEIFPYVYVRDSGSKVFEQACGSGSLSLGVYLNDTGGENLIEVLQPGGMITVETGDKCYLTGDVFFTCEGSVDIAEYL